MKIIFFEIKIFKIILSQKKVHHLYLPIISSVAIRFRKILIIRCPLLSVGIRRYPFTDGWETMHKAKLWWKGRLAHPRGGPLSEALDGREESDEEG